MIELLFFFLLGAIIGSFLNCIIYRLEIDESFTKGRSYCPKCKHVLGFFDLVPILSFVSLKGKCRYCKENISWQYPIVEFFTAMIFVLNYMNFFNNSILFIFSCIISAFLIVTFVYDLKHCLVPVDFVYWGIGLTFIFHLINFYFVFSQANPNNIGIAYGFWLYIWPYLLGALVPFLFFLFLHLISKGQWMGLGDSKIGFLLGLILGYPNVLISLLLAVFLGAIMGLILIFSKQKGLKSEMPFGPFLIFGFYLMFFFGEIFIEIYHNLFLW
ncbi:MAG TPA: prepilin peptidase [Candidatus Pacearchaeota archaeon]|nr:prepilin peptidase [Candidatus Pacearchaeota archaeon]